MIPIRLLGRLFAKLGYVGLILSIVSFYPVWVLVSTGSLILMAHLEYISMTHALLGVSALSISQAVLLLRKQ